MQCTLVNDCVVPDTLLDDDYTVSENCGQSLLSALHRKSMSQGFEYLYMKNDLFKVCLRCRTENISASAKSCELNTMYDQG